MPTAKSYQCQTCAAPLRLDRAKNGILRCVFCGNDHRLSDAKAEQERELLSETRLGTLMGPYVFAPIVGFAANLAARDWWWGPYEGVPVLALGILFVILGIMSLRMSAALGLTIVGLSGVAKPFIRPLISRYDNLAMSPMSESSFYYLIPGLIGVGIGLAFLASLKVRDLKPALQAAKPRFSVVVAFAAGVAVAQLGVGSTVRSVIEAHRGEVEHLETLAINVCGGSVARDLTVSLASPPVFHHGNRTKESNTIIASCASLVDLHGRGTDPLYIANMNHFLGWLKQPRDFHYQGISSGREQDYRRLSVFEYVVVYSGSATEVKADLLEIKNARIVRSLVASGATFSTTRDALFRSLEEASGGVFRDR